MHLLMLLMICSKSLHVLELVLQRMSGTSRVLLHARMLTGCETSEKCTNLSSHLLHNRSPAQDPSSASAGA